MFSAGLGGAIMKDGNPLNLHFVMFIPTLLGQGTLEQVGDVLGRAWELGLVGTYAQTELGHGSFIRGLELTATYRVPEEEWELHSPTLTSYKWWPGGLGHTATHAVVMARLVTLGRDRGVHPFLVQLRDEATHRPLPGVILGEIGPKLGMNSNNQGFLGFVRHRVPRVALLARHAQVERDGAYHRPEQPKAGYATMVFVRTAIGLDVALQLRKAVTIAVRYSAVRRQGEPAAGADREPRVLDYPTQQEKVLPPLALALGLHLAATAVWERYNSVQVEVEQGDYTNLPGLHALACAIKVVVTAESARAVDQLRRACGGHGYMASSNLPCIFGMVTAACTYEGENTVLLLQIARYLVKAADLAAEGADPPAGCPYLAPGPDSGQGPDLASDCGLVRLFDQVLRGAGPQCDRVQVARGEVLRAAAALKAGGWSSASILLTQARGLGD
jgi:acyl-CoA oxidase